MVQDRPVGAGAVIAPMALSAVSGRTITIPDPRRLVHLQFRRFAGCPVCNLHLQSFRKRHAEIAHANIHEVVVFHSPADELAKHVNDLPFDLVADPERRLYRRFGVESSPRALLDPRVWIFILAGVVNSVAGIAARGYGIPSMAPHGGRFGLPGDFLIDPNGRVMAVKYGEHAYDQWSVDELLQLGAIAETPDDRRPR